MTDIDGGGAVLLPGEARTIDIGAFLVTVHADAATTDGQFSLIETGESVEGGGPPLHIHRDCAESFVVLAGSFVFVPKGTVHTFRTLDGGSRKLNLYTPAAMVGYFDELAEGIARGMSEGDLDAIAGRYAMDVVGPVPESYLEPS